MRRVTPLLLAVSGLLVACGPEPVKPPPAPGPGPVATPGEGQPGRTVDTGDARTWVERNFAAGWFPEMAVVEEEMEAGGDAGLGARRSGRVFGGRAGNRGDVPPDSRSNDDPAPATGGGPPAQRPAPGTANFGPATEGVPEMDGDGEVEYPEPLLEDDEMNPRFGGAGEDYGEDKSEDDAPFEGPRARTGTWKRARVAPNTSKLMVGDVESLPPESFQATLRVDGFRARVVLDLTYRNVYEDAGQLEGFFKLRVPDGATVHYLAFGDVAETSPLLLPAAPNRPLELGPAAITAARSSAGDFLREARMVPRAKAVRVYAAETARKVDPALMEWAGAGVFSARVFPLLPGRVHRVTVAYDTELVLDGDRAKFSLDLPQDVKERRVLVESAGQLLLDPAVEIRHVGDRVLSVLENPEGSRVTVSVPGVEGAALTGSDPAVGAHFATLVTPRLPVGATAPRDRAVFLVDVSASSNPDRMNVWKALLREVLTANRGDLREFAVLFFNVESWWWREEMTPNTADQVEALLADVQDLTLEGATDLGRALFRTAAPGWAPQGLGADLFLLSDGAVTWGAMDAVQAAGNLDAPVFAYTTGLQGTDTRALAALARASGGAVFSVVGDGEVARAAVAHRSRPWLLREVRVAGATDILVAGNPSALFPGQRLRIAGRGTPRVGDEVLLVLEQDGVTRELGVPITAVHDSVLAARAYGQIATGRMEDLGVLAEAESRAYATHYRVTGPTCSLLMLENEEAYQRYGIVPEDDARVVNERPVARVERDVAAEMERLTSDGRTAFLAWLDRLERLSGVTFDGLDLVRRQAAGLPEEAFEPVPRESACTLRGWNDVPGAYQELLAAGKVDYDSATAEALRRLEAAGTDDALRALSTLVEEDPGSSDLLRDVAFTALEWDLPGEAESLLRRVSLARPHEPETYRALADCMVRTGRIDAAMLVYEVALRGAWDGRFGAFRLIAAMDYARLLGRIERGEVATTLGALAADARERVGKEFLTGQPDIVITMTWNTDRTDVDLHVVDPKGEDCHYGHPRTSLGGAITADVTQGFGPEMFVQGKAAPGTYAVKAHYYGSDSLRRTLRSRAYLSVHRNFGRADEVITRHSIRLDAAKDMQDVVTITWE